MEFGELTRKARRLINHLAARRAKEFFGQDNKTHSWDHVERVRQLCNDIGRKEGANLFILELASSLHDVGRFIEGGGDHAYKSAQFARQWLVDLGIGEIAEEVADAILTHSYSCKREPESLEAKVLSDGDKLDAMGATGIMRIIAYSIVHERDVFDDSANHIQEKLLKLFDLLKTPSAKKIGQERHDFLVRFLEEMKLEGLLH